MKVFKLTRAFRQNFRSLRVEDGIEIGIHCSITFVTVFHYICLFLV